MIGKPSAEEIIRGFNNAKAAKAVVESTTEDLLYYAFPRKRGVNSKYEPGEKPSWDIFDSTAAQSNLILAAGLSGYMTNSAQRWFELRTRNERLMQDKEIATFFVDCAEEMYATYANSNFYQQVHEAYIDLGVVGTAGMYQDEDVIDDVRFYTRHFKEIFLAEDDREVVNMVYRSFEMTAYQAISFFGEKNVTERIRKAIYEEKNYDKKFLFIHYVCPRHVRNPNKKDAGNKPFASYWVAVEDKKILREGGYEEFPYTCPRFYKNSGEVYGYSPAWTCYPDITMANKAGEVYIKGAEISVYPPWLAEHDGMMGTLDLRAGAINYQRQPLAQGAAIQSLGNKANFQVGLDFIQRTEEKIRQAYFVDLFLMLAQHQNMTATEVVERTQEKMLIMSPVLGRLQTELLNPLVYRTFNILLRRGKFPPVPEKLKGKAWDVVYVSPLAKAQRAVMARDMQTFAVVIGQMAQVAPEVLDIIDADKFADRLAKAYSVDPDIIRDQEERDGRREQRAQAMAQQAQLASLGQVASIAATAGQADERMQNARAKRQGEGATK